MALEDKSESAHIVHFVVVERRQIFNEVQEQLKAYRLEG